MTYASSFRKVKKVLTSVSAGGLNNVLVQGGRMYGTDDRMVVSTPFDSDLEFFVNAETLGSALLAQDVELFMQDNVLIVKSGDDLDHIVCAPPVEMKRPKGKWIPVPETMIPAFETLCPFQADDRTREWACAITIRDGHTFATNNRILGVWDGGNENIKATFPSWLVDYILTLDEEPEDLIIDETWIGFRFKDGTEVRSARLEREMIEAAVDMGLAIERKGNKIPKAWLAAVEHVASLPGCDMIMIAPDRMYAQTGSGSRQRLIKSPTTKETLWDPVFMSKVAEVATHINLDNWPGPATWYGPKVRGLIAGKSK